MGTLCSYNLKILCQADLSLSLTPSRPARLRPRKHSAPPPARLSPAPAYSIPFASPPRPIVDASSAPPSYSFDPVPTSLATRPRYAIANTNAVPTPIQTPVPLGLDLSSRYRPLRESRPLLLRPIRPDVDAQPPMHTTTLQLPSLRARVYSTLSLPCNVVNIYLMHPRMST
ncbi:hypothetical protein C8R43DRAFT_1238522, partial [Mycena crocata]